MKAGKTFRIRYMLPPPEKDRGIEKFLRVTQPLYEDNDPLFELLQHSLRSDWYINSKCSFEDKPTFSRVNTLVNEESSGENFNPNFTDTDVHSQEIREHLIVPKTIDTPLETLQEIDKHLEKLRNKNSIIFSGQFQLPWGVPKLHNFEYVVLNFIKLRKDMKDKFKKVIQKFSSKKQEETNDNLLDDTLTAREQEKDFVPQPLNIPSSKDSFFKIKLNLPIPFKEEPLTFQYHTSLNCLKDAKDSVTQGIASFNNVIEKVQDIKDLLQMS